ncbi:ZIP family metal transporter [Patescibacteria group bacterium]|nr:ZIP family metal transporter [Patescibacteria group bacterium]MBU1952204.1 ZIP family metal transporter [Patescibacteria group bacterium]
MTEIWIYTIGSVFIVSLVSLIGILAISMNMERLKKGLLFLVSFAAGSLLGGAFIHLIPEIFKESEHSEILPFIVLLGFLLFFVLEKILHWRHCHVPTSKDHPHPLAVNNLVGDGFHNLIDGMIIAGSYLVSIPLGIATTIAVLLHEIPQEIGDFGILVHAGYSKKKALIFNFLSALTSIVGAILTLVIGSVLANTQEFLIAFTAGGFIYIAAADLIPEMKKETDFKKSWLQLSALVFGIGVMALLLLLE